MSITEVLLTLFCVMESLVFFCMMLTMLYAYDEYAEQRMRETGSLLR